ncbi:hypothetical protein HMI54_008289 [Coelomomyces lativittatus]|nr:hypothetical protein HMI54_008289 [Coelomomyces lativittatus]KAJ1508330.1 hypothetical protein HMI56_007342 [Coelomomyces lativittatus]KAJ1515343.1 hypothetical protein HMI55_003793 [Coelomomyces lativittatus]
MISDMTEILNPYPSPTLSPCSISTQGPKSSTYSLNSPSPLLQPIKKRLKPPHPYPYLIVNCFLKHSSPTMRLPQIFSSLEAMYPYYFISGCQNWKSTVRFNLSRSKIFLKSHNSKIAKKGPGRLQSEWCIHPTWKAKILEEGVEALRSIGDARKSRILQLSTIHIDKRLRVSSLLN